MAGAIKRFCGKRARLMLAAGLIAAALPSSAAAAAPSITKFSHGLSGFPEDMVAGPDGRVWFTEGRFPIGSGGMIGRITRRGRIIEFKKGIHGVMYADSSFITVGPDGNIWFTESDVNDNHGIIGRITRHGKVTEFHRGLRTFSDITIGPDGNIWFAGGSGVGFITPTGHVHIVSRQIRGGGITTGPDGDIWVSDSLTRITPAGQVKEFPFPINGFSADAVTGSDGNLWYAENGSIARAVLAPGSTGMTVSSQRSLSIGSPQGYVHALTVGPDHNVWFAAQNETGFAKIGFITPHDDVARLPQELGGTNGSFLDGIAAGKDGNVWFTDNARPVGGGNGPHTIDRVNLRR